MAIDRAQLQLMLGSPALEILIQKLRRRFERGDRRAIGSLRLNALSSEQRDAIDGLLGRRPTSGSPLIIQLEALDRVIVGAGFEQGLCAAIEALTGPIENRADLKLRQHAEWNRVFASATQRLQDRANLLPWIEYLRRHGVLKRIAGRDTAQAEALLSVAIDAALQLPHRGTTRSRFAAELTGDAHALDHKSKLGRILTWVLRFLSRSSDVKSPSRYRRAWERVGVTWHELSSSVLVLNLNADGDTTAGKILNVCAAAGEPCRLTARQLLHQPPRWNTTVAPQSVFICENPSVILAVVQTFGSRSQPIICTEGQPSTAVRLLLHKLLEKGVQLHYHGDFDWPGITIANHMNRYFAVQPWRMSAADYRAKAQTAQLPLTGRKATALWDPELTLAMQSLNVAIHEEQVLDELMGDLGMG